MSVTPSPSWARSVRSPQILLTIAVTAGLLHALASAYWAVGGRWLLPTVGTWAVDLAETHPIAAGLGLAALAGAKATAALLAPRVISRSNPAPHRARAAFWVIGACLAVYGALNTIGGLIALTGVLGAVNPQDHAAVVGHAFLWDPLFLIWGGALMGALRSTRPEAQVIGAADRRSVA